MKRSNGVIIKEATGLSNKWMAKQMGDYGPEEEYPKITIFKAWQEPAIP